MVSPLSTTIAKNGMKINQNIYLDSRNPGGTYSISLNNSCNLPIPSVSSFRPKVRRIRTQNVVTILMVSWIKTIKMISHYFCEFLSLE